MPVVNEFEDFVVELLTLSFHQHVIHRDEFAMIVDNHVEQLLEVSACHLEGCIGHDGVNAAIGVVQNLSSFRISDYDCPTSFTCQTEGRKLKK